ncbi:hypothetical protein [Shimia biformata]|uniref:hypothetical protein n=1 Tax=Shimia biformata TaxID=1294299 RepID=UPI001950F460|nr:hypothetical protein [Shimia biformata]
MSGKSIGIAMLACAVALMIGMIGFVLLLNRFADQKSEIEYNVNAVRMLTYPTMISYPSTVVADADGEHRRTWDAPCIKTTRPTEITGTTTEGKWPAGGVPQCGDFFATATRADDSHAFAPARCLPLLVLPYDPSGDPGQVLVVHASDAVIQLDPPKDTPEQARTGVAALDRAYKAYADAEAFDLVSARVTDTAQCDGFAMTRVGVRIYDLDRLRQTVPAWHD